MGAKCVGRGPTVGLGGNSVIQKETVVPPETAEEFEDSTQIL